jgi:hypothetical protein
MKVAETLLAALVVTLAVFVGTQAKGSSTFGESQSAGIIASDAAAGQTPAQPIERAVAASDADTRPTTELATGRAEGRLATNTQYVRDVPRDASWSAADMRRRLSQGAGGTYIDELLTARDSVVTRWPDRRLTPLRVWVADAGDQEGWNASFPTVVRDAFESWSATGIPVRFTYVRDSASADVHVRFVPQFVQGISGRTIWSRDGDWWLVGGDVELAINHPMGGAVTPTQLRAITLHEIGHLLGLDHVEDASHIMAPRVRVRELSEADIATVRLVYSVPAGSARERSAATSER